MPERAPTPRQRLAELTKLTGSQWADLARALLALPLTGASLALLGFRQTQRLVDAATAAALARADGDDATRVRARSAARMVELAARYGPYRASCLKRALALRLILGRRGIAAEVKIGVRRGDARDVEGHAWVEVAGEVLLDRPDVEQRFTAFDGLWKGRDR